jgi:hypothetical protein
LIEAHGEKMTLELPDLERPFDHENAFYLSSDVSRLGKLLAHYELYRRTANLAGAIVECGVFKGLSLIRFATFRQLCGANAAKRIIGFDMFGPFPKTAWVDDVGPREKFIQEAGSQSIGRDQLIEILARKGIGENVELVEGDIRDTLPAYLDAHPELAVSLLNLDTDVYEPATTILEALWPRVVPGGIALLDDFGVFPGETKAVREFFANTDVRFEQLSLNATPTFVVK